MVPFIGYKALFDRAPGNELEYNCRWRESLSTALDTLPVANLKLLVLKAMVLVVLRLLRLSL